MREPVAIWDRQAPQRYRVAPILQRPVLIRQETQLEIEAPTLRRVAPPPSAALDLLDRDLGVGPPGMQDRQIAFSQTVGHVVEQRQRTSIPRLLRGIALRARTSLPGESPHTNALAHHREERAVVADRAPRQRVGQATAHMLDHVLADQQLLAPLDSLLQVGQLLDRPWTSARELLQLGLVSVESVSDVSGAGLAPREEDRARGRSAGRRGRGVSGQSSSISPVR